MVVMVSIDVRRTTGGLQLFIDGGQPWAMRLSYGQAERLVDAIRCEELFCAVVGEVTVAWLPQYPEIGDGYLTRFDGEITEDRCNVTREVRLGRQHALHLAGVLAAHLPDRLAPLPGTHNDPWVVAID